MRLYRLSLLLAAMRSPAAGVMIARGDLTGAGGVLTGAGAISQGSGPVQIIPTDESQVPVARAAELRRRHRWKLPDAFQAALAINAVPMFNTIYADADGNIYYHWMATLPVRAEVIVTAVVVALTAVTPGTVPDATDSGRHCCDVRPRSPAPWPPRAGRG